MFWRFMAMTELSRNERELTAVSEPAPLISVALVPCVKLTESLASAEVELLTDEPGERLTRLDRDAHVQRLLTELKARRSLPA